MRAYTFRLPDVGEGVAEAEIVAWHIAVGDRVAEDQPTVDVMTDKATVEMTSPVAGRVVACHGAVGERRPVGAPLIEIALAAEDESATEGEAEAASAAPPRPLASPATRRRAREFGIALASIDGSGPQGRVTAEDVARAASAPTDARVREVPLVGLRRRIAERMAEAKRRIPHFGYVEEVDMTELAALRHELDARRAPGTPRLSVLAFLMRGIALLVPRFPHINAHFDDERDILRVHDAVHVGIATRTDAGLLVPVVRHVETLDLAAASAALARVTEAAREGRARREELSGSTLTLSSLGALGGISATPVINHPEVAIVAPNRMVERPVVRRGAIAIRTMMNVSSAFDHRIVDGHEAASFIGELKRLLEHPALLFLPPTKDTAGR